MPVRRLDPEVLRDPEQQPGPRHHARAIGRMVREAPADGQTQAPMRLDAVLEPRIGHPDRHPVVITEQAVVPAIFIARPIEAALQQLATAQDVRNAGIDAVEALVEIGGGVDQARDAGKVYGGILVVLAVVGSGLQLGPRRQASAQGHAIVLGTVIERSGLGAVTPGVDTPLAVVEGVRQEADLEGLGDVEIELRHVVIPAESRTGRVKVLRSQVVWVAFVALDCQKTGPAVPHEPCVGAQVYRAQRPSGCRYVRVKASLRLARDHVDHAPNRVGTVQRGGGPLDDLDPL